MTDYWGLMHSRVPYARVAAPRSLAEEIRYESFCTVVGADVARVVALACEGPVWQRTWGVTVDGKGKVVAVPAPEMPPPTFAWLGDYTEFEVVGGGEGVQPPN